ncbi:MAG: permease-like cell division protein FtsX [Oscillospiraceae bacterium]|nr:permease-like cell division protein FtsX [Oscillospiraceae bacterium]MBR2366654.1 permease-like cell division protein FtsX [Oscillospiraceae bacterium]MBR2897492.1 permease-like cell division protein FtsX [Oscillospiraceae bacterium]MBR2977589.1 permease-like cell division protein FtsX [Oscillospiraceae bacterium]
MRNTKFSYLMREGVRALFRHGFRSMAAILVIIACLIIMGSFFLLSYNLNVMVEKLESENEILVYINESYTEAEAKSVGSKINMIANVEQSRFISRDEALQRFIEEQNDPTIFEGISAETLRDRFAVKLVNNALIKQTVAEIENIEGVAKTNAHYEISNGFETVQNILNFVSIAAMLGLLVVSLFIISNTIKLAMYDRKEEIAIMRIVGATRNFIRFPFLIEGILLGLFGSLAAFFVEWGVYDLLAARIHALDVLQMFTIVPFNSLMWFVFGAYLITGFLVGTVGSMMSIRKFLRV